MPSITGVDAKQPDAADADWPRSKETDVGFFLIADTRCAHRQAQRPRRGTAGRSATACPSLYQGAHQQFENEVGKLALEPGIHVKIQVIPR